MYRSFLIALLAVGLAAPALHAQTAEELEAANELLETLRIPEQLEHGLTSTLKQQVKANPMLAEYSDLLEEFSRRVADWDEMKDDVLAMYASQYSVEDMRELTAFFSTPLGQRYLDGVLPMMAEMQALTQRRWEELSPEFMAALSERMGN